MSEIGFGYNLDELSKLCKKSTQVVGWYPHRYSGQIRGPYYRWFILQPGSDDGQGRLASPEDDIEFAAAAMNTLPHLVIKIQELEQIIKDKDAVIEGHSNGMNHIWDRVSDRNARINELEREVETLSSKIRELENSKVKGLDNGRV